jgi:hypothetical protein
MKNLNSNLNPDIKIEYNIQHTLHSHARCVERNINDNDIQEALNYSEAFFKQGLVIHVVKDRLIPENLPDSLVSRIRNLVIIVGGDESQIITCYRSPKAFKRIKRKSNRLIRYN